MMNRDFEPDLSSFAGDYQILTALRSVDHSRTYLARHRKLNRDVTITVMRPRAGDDAMADRLAEDAKVLAVKRHRSVIPVIEGRKLPDGSFAIVRARVRGQTLEQLVANVGAMPVARVASTLEQVHSAIEWARQNQIANRNVTADAIVFQQGSGRVLLELEPPPNAGVADACEDARTVGRLAYEMLSGHRESDTDAKPLGEVRPDLSPRIVKETESLMQCDTNRGARDVIALIALLSGKSESAAVPATPRTSRPAAVIQPGPLDSAVVVVKRPFGYAARLATAVAVIAIIATLGIILLNRRGDETGPRETAGEVQSTKSSAGGEVVPAVPRPDTSYRAPSSGTIVPNPTLGASSPPATSAPLAVGPTVPAPTAASAPIAALPVEPKRRPEPPVKRRSEPPVVAPSRMPDPVEPSRDTAVRPVVTAPDTVTPLVVTPPVIAPPKPVDGCDSPDASDQQRCLSNAIERNDRDLNSTYQRLIAALRRQAGVDPAAADPPSVDALREAQRHWVETRDVACRDAGSGPLYARARSECFAAQSSRRTSELLDRLRSIPDGR